MPLDSTDLYCDLSQGHGMAPMASDTAGHSIGVDRACHVLSTGHRGTAAHPSGPSRFPPVAPVALPADSRSPGQRPDNRLTRQPSPRRGLKLRRDLSACGDSSSRHGTSTASSGSHGGLPDDTTSVISGPAAKQVIPSATHVTVTVVATMHLCTNRYISNCYIALNHSHAQ